MKCALLFFLAFLSAQSSFAQHPLVQGYQPRPSPETEYARQQMKDKVMKQLDKIDWSQVSRTTSGDTILYTIPVVVHVLHNYGAELLPDSAIYNMISSMNTRFLKTNPDTVNIINKYKSVAASTQIAFKLATIDPYGNPTKGVEHIYSYLTYADYGLFSLNLPDQSKLNQWPQERYYNIWMLNTIGYFYGYGYSSYDASYYPYYDGALVNFNIYGSLLSNITAEYLNLPFPCGPYACDDGDGIPDTPPCYAGSFYCGDIYDTTCDTPNVQNIMINTDTCSIMFTYGQGQYMQSVLQLDFGNRDSLITPYTYASTGMGQPMPDMLPVADFSISYGTPNTQPYKRFYWPGQIMRFYNNSWNDTIVAASWTFSNSANTAASTSLTTVNNAFHQPGWVTVTLAATGNNTGTTTLTDTAALYIADSVATSAVGYTQEFIPGAGMESWPMFNYYNNGFKWQTANVGYFDHSCLQYSGYDERNYPYNMTGTPQGDVDDIYTPAFDLTGFTDSCYLNFMSSGATIATEARYIKDTLEIDYSKDETYSWHELTSLYGNELANKGLVSTSFLPSGMGDWLSHAVSIPSAIRTGRTIFRLRYHPGADSVGVSTGNNFYLDHFNFSGLPESVVALTRMPTGISVEPNPAHGSTSVIIKDNTAIIQGSLFITDITGKVVYETKITNGSNTAQVQIPASAFTSKGLYLVHVVTSSTDQTEKLVIY